MRASERKQRFEESLKHEEMCRRWRQAPRLFRLSVRILQTLSVLCLLLAVSFGMSILEPSWNYAKDNLWTVVGLGISAVVGYFGWRIAKELQWGHESKPKEARQLAKPSEDIPLPSGVEAKKGYWRLYIFVPDVGIRHVQDFKLDWTRKYGETQLGNVAASEEPLLLIDDTGRVLAHSASWVAYVHN